MFRIFTKLFFALSLVLATGSVGFGQDYYKGYAAHKRGDYAAAEREWRPLAEKGDAQVQASLGLMYYRGEGVIQDYVYAHMWWNIAASSGNGGAQELAQKYRDEIAKVMTAEQIAKAQELARECVRNQLQGC